MMNVSVNRIKLICFYATKSIFILFVIFITVNIFMFSGIYVSLTSAIISLIIIYFLYKNSKFAFDLIGGILIFIGIINAFFSLLISRVIIENYQIEPELIVLNVFFLMITILYYFGQNKLKDYNKQ